MMQRASETRANIAILARSRFRILKPRNPTKIARYSRAAVFCLAEQGQLL